MSRTYTQLPSFREVEEARKRAEESLGDDDLAAREGFKTLNLVDADGLNDFRERHGRRTAASFLRLQAALLRVDQMAVARGRAEAAAADARQHSGGAAPNAMAPPLWVLAIVFVFSIDLALGRYLMARAAPDDSDLLVGVATIGVGVWVFATSHFTGHVLVDLLDGTAPAVMARRLFAAGIFVGLYCGFVAWVLAATNVGGGRWAISFVPLVAGCLVQTQRPDPAVWRRAASAFRHMVVSRRSSLASRRCNRAAERFAIELLEARIFWLHQGAVRRSVAGQWGLSDEGPSIDNTLDELGRLEVIGVVPSRSEIQALFDRLAGHGLPEVTLTGPDRDFDNDHRQLVVVDRYADSRRN